MVYSSLKNKLTRIQYSCTKGSKYAGCFLISYKEYTNIDPLNLSLINESIP